MTQITFNNKNSYVDFGITIESIDIQPPSKKKIKDSVPFMNGSYDFSTIGTGGEAVYNEREIKIRFNLVTRDKLSLYLKYSKVLEWLLGTGQQKLIFNFMQGYYFLAEVENAPSFEEVLQRAGKLEVNFICEPFKYGADLAGDLLWDNIDFELPDYIQNTLFTISGSQTVTLYNPSNHSIIPKVVCNSNMSCTLNSYTANFTTTKNIDWQFKLLPGENNIQITGTGNISFEFRKEVL
ncbi:putative phage tail component [Clostridium pasteurianum DSM 525 = ATCC 6013]|uniref:Putative phage tail component n=1 Tax=Clostridium pasteurianum DSM 525 = ATCC 6013 TaxID=1262449 RepID=A0A0H3J688_CLOPA|nr:distal tail protein Dit [Clostridium pasteurianum]AJA49526.1 putative phage tail component [Clostridium pasteurianum DSM 525 = ATCC 6013]AJA53514.1 putative phage tail component [Clostridium pasteurianum DSM 525 = ATCC 6013]AOZ76686.1 phage tail protein [Clostridium pasteurianum DSM 525 = ATCC 6013]AOZ80483.1 phage tail protein [Clostridium pasteurianum]ELP58956.1 lj928 prophage protein [Clostridium pasteurianum DSM 525 = ATCC 6013]